MAGNKTIKALFLVCRPRQWTKNLLIYAASFFTFSFNSIAQNLYSGTVIDENSEPIFGASIIVKKNSNFVQTDIDGKFLVEAEINDILLNKKTIKIFKSKKYYSKNTHGTGCSLSSAIATNLSCGKDLIKSCELGIKYVNESIKSNLNLGKGNGPINHLNSIMLNKKFK